jgi:hypothetical protein
MKAKTILLITVLLSLFTATYSQVPQSVHYQAVVRDNTGAPVTNQSVSLKITILQESESGPAVYIETHSPVTNAFGIVNIEIGSGTVVYGSFSSINWGTSEYFVKTDIDVTGGTNYLSMGTSQLVSVPYALYALKSLTTEQQNNYTAGTGIDITNNVITNTAPDQTLTLYPGTGISVTGSYPVFTITNSSPSQWVTNGSDIYYQSGKVGIGLSQPDNSALLDVSSTNKGFLVPRMTLAQRNAIGSPSTGLMIFQTDNTPGFYYNAGTSGSPNWKLVGDGTLNLPYSGTTSSADPAFQVTNSGSGDGIKGIVVSASKTGVTGEAPNQGIFGNATATTGSAYGVQGTSASSTGSGVTGYGSSTSGQNFGVKGLSASPDGKGVYGYAGSSSGTSYGVYGISSSSAGYGVYGEGKTALYGITSAVNGYGIYVQCTDASSTPRGVYASVASGFSGYFSGGTFFVSGNVGIGAVSPTQMLDVNGNARIRAIGSGAYYGQVNRMADGTLTTATSDARLKENVCSLQDCLEKVMQLRGVSFTWKTNPEYGTRIGFIAQEFEKVVPELVFTNEVDGYKGINYGEVSAMLVEAIKELKAENDWLKTENEKLKMNAGQINARLEKIETLMSLKAEK